jgi:hypothetical protein
VQQEDRRACPRREGADPQAIDRDEGLRPHGCAGPAAPGTQTSKKTHSGSHKWASW